MAEDARDARVLDDLFEIIESRKGANPEASYTAGLLAAGTPKAAQKTGEEAVEVTIAALAETPERLAAESADLLYHLLVLLAARDLTLDDVRAELTRRRH